MEISMGRIPTAMIPPVLSLAAVYLALIQLWIDGGTPESHPGALAHLWLMLMLAQVPLIAFFALRWLRRVPRQALKVLAVQLLAAATALVPMRFLGWYWGSW